MASYGLRYYIELRVGGKVVCNWSQLDKPTLPELKALTRSAAGIGPIRLSATATTSGPIIDGFDCEGVTYGVFSKEVGLQLAYFLSVELRPNDPEYTDAFGRRAPEWTEEMHAEYDAMWQELAPARCL
jgi:hypothetical protein